MFSFFKSHKGEQSHKKISRDDLEDRLLEADIDYELVEEIIYHLPPVDAFERSDIKRVLASIFSASTKELQRVQPHIDLILGVNGAGKTTTIAKLANRYKQEGRLVMLGAADTFRAAAIEQLKIWAQKIDVPIVFTKQGHDPSAVAYDTISSAKAKGIERVIIDTAGRLHTHSNLLGELEKIVRICDKAMSGAPHRKILVIDGTQGTSTLSQAKNFHESVGVDGIIITKLDGTSRGGSIFAISMELKLPILYVGVGEGMDDLKPFDKEEYLDELLDFIFEKEE
jgi:fused signal recognition particle receptor